MKNLVINIVATITALIVGFLICFYMLGKDLDSTMNQTNIISQLTLLNTVLDQVNTNISSNGPDGINSFYNVICSMLPNLKQEAINAGEPFSEVVSAVEAAGVTIERYKLAVKNIDSVTCDI